MKGKFFAPDLSDKRIIYAINDLEKMGYARVDFESNADFVLLGVNPDKKYLDCNKAVFAGNIKADNIYDYTKCESFALKNAYLTAESAIAVAIDNDDESLINNRVLIAGYGRIGKALHKLLGAYTNDITVCARNENARTLAECCGSAAVDFDSLKNKNDYKFVFNTVAHPVFNKDELDAMNKASLIIDLASFPGGVDKHIAKANSIKLIAARGLPAKYSPKTAGRIVAQTVDEMINVHKII